MKFGLMLPNKGRPYGDAGATWWVEEIFTGRGALKKIRQRIADGPPR